MDTCYHRSLDHLGSSTTYADSMTLSGDSYFSTDKAQNPVSESESGTLANLYPNPVFTEHR